VRGRRAGGSSATDLVPAGFVVDFIIRAGGHPAGAPSASLPYPCPPLANKRAGLSNGRQDTPRDGQASTMSNCTAGLKRAPWQSACSAAHRVTVQTPRRVNPNGFASCQATAGGSTGTALP
jgi:hypothetical protein